MLLPVITAIVIESLVTGSVPDCFKTAVISPLLKKPGLETNSLKCYRPVSNLPFMSKTLERAVAQQLTAHMTAHNLPELLQSACKAFHSTETALIKVHNDVLCAMDKQGIVILLLLDLSTAFDTIDPRYPLTRMETELGIHGTILKWFTSYLTGRTQCVQVNGKCSAKSLLSWGVPQGSVLGPLLFLIYTLPLGRQVKKHGLDLHIYADDTQLYICIRPASQRALGDAVSKVQTCVKYIEHWMTTNMLKLNSDKTEISLIGSAAHLRKVNLDTILIGNTPVPIHSDRCAISERCLTGTCHNGCTSQFPHQVPPPLRSTVVRSSARGAGGRGSIPYRVTPKT